MKHTISFVILISCAFFVTGCWTLERMVKAKSTGIVIVGMGQSAKYGKCDGAVKDATTMNGILVQYGTPTMLLNNQATKANVVNALKAAARNDLLIFYYSGHGGSDKIGDVSDEPDKKNEYLCLYNTYLLDNEIWDIVCTANNRVFLIFDCCHSETMFREPGVDFSELMSRDASADVLPGMRGVTVLCWSGCADDTYSYGDSAEGGVLTKAIHQSFDKDKTYGKMWFHVTNKMPDYQVPKKTEIGDWPNTRIFR